MFSRRRAQSNPPAKTPPTAAALTAAGQAFLANRSSNANLSNAAAAAALRSYTTSPVPVGEIQTRRMIQRRGSASSNGSSRPGGLQRRDSGGSMTERTFRDPSPNRKTSSGYRYEDPPPVPVLPKGYTSPPPLPAKSNRRAASVEPPERVLSPPPKLPNGRGVSLDRGPGLMASQLRARTQAKSPQIDPAGGIGHGQNRDSVNYSRPMSPANSPPTSPLNDRRSGPAHSQIPKQQASSNIANVGRLRDGEAENIQYALQETAQAPVKKKKKKVAKNAEGSYLANAGSGGRAAGTAIHADDIRQQPSTDSASMSTDAGSGALSLKTPPQSLPKKTKKKAATSTDPRLGEPAYGSYPSDSDSVVSERSNVNDRPRTYNTRASGLLAKQPSIVREDREAEEQEEHHDPPARTNTPAQNGNAQKSTAAKKPEAMLNGRQDVHSLDQSSNVHTHTKAASLDIPNTKDNFMLEKTLNTQPIRHPSLSPARAAHFSAQPVLETPDSLKHQPPARSISPAKSALKHSPSRGPSPVASVSGLGNRWRGPASEASDTTSMISDDGPKSAPKKKKSARVSFDSESVVVGRAATPPTDQDSPMIMSPQNREASTMKWLGLANDRGHTVSSNKDQETSIQPTPALPLFGSVRGRAQQNQPPDSAQEPPESAPTTTELGTSSDQRIGGILSRVFGSQEIDHGSQKQVPSSFGEPLPPEVTTVEGTGYHSDTDTSTYSDKVQESQVPGPTFPEAAIEKYVRSDRLPAQNEPATTAEQSPSPENKSMAPSIAVQPPTPALGNTPSIAIQPATPGLDEISKSRDQYWFDMPGGFPVSADDSTNEESRDTVGIGHRPPELTPATIGMAEPEPEAVAAQHRPGTPVVGAVAEGLRIQTDPDTHEESDDTNNSIYSDAAEDLSDIEGDGFGSINAIVESPASPHLGLLDGRQPASPTKATKNITDSRPSPLSRNESELSEPGSEAGWDQAQAYWSGLSQTRKQQIERAAAQGDLTESSKALKPKTKKRKIVPKKPIEDGFMPSLNQESKVLPGRPASPKTPLRARNPAMKSSMRDIASEAPQGTQMRSSMRDSAPAKSSVRASLPPEPTTETRGGALRKKNRPVSAVASSDYSKPLANPAYGHDRSASLGTPQSNTMSTTARTPKTKSPLPKPIRRTVSNGSDSSSSFKKARSRTSDGGRYTMKRSMRGSSVDDQPTSMHGRASSMTARTSSPADTARRPFSSVGPSMRTSMRDSIESSKPNRAKSPSRFPGFGKSSKPKAAAKGPASRFSSRFADSSDEDDGPIIRRSRYADSSDEDEPAGLTPVRGIPRRIDEGDSTDLEDSSADEKAASSSNKTRPQQSSKLEGAALGAGSLRAIPEAGDSPTASMGTGLQAKRAAEKEKKKRTFFGGLGSKKTPKSEPLTLPTSGEGPLQDTISAQQGPTLDTSVSNAPGSPQSTKQQRLLGPGSPMGDSQASPTAQKSPKSPKLQRRVSAQQAEKIQMKRGFSDSWPPPQSPGGTSTPTGRPTTSDGTPKIKNSMIGASGLGNEVPASRPGMGDRMNTVETTATGGTGTVKKKKGWFKKAFRL